MRRIVARVGIAIIVTVSVLFSVISPAAAACQVYQLNLAPCTISWNSYRISDLTTTAQVILKYGGVSGVNPGIVDGDYGTSISSNTAQAVIDYQGAYDVTQDGVTGSTTWGLMEGDLDYDGAYTSTYFYEGTDGTLATAYPLVSVPSTGGTDRVAFRYSRVNGVSWVWSVRTTPDQWVLIDSSRS